MKPWKTKAAVAIHHAQGRARTRPDTMLGRCTRMKYFTFDWWADMGKPDSPKPYFSYIKQITPQLPTDLPCVSVRFTMAE